MQVAFDEATQRVRQRADEVARELDNDNDAEDGCDAPAAPAHAPLLLEETHIFSEPCCEGTDAACRETPIDVKESLGMSKRSMSNKLESRIAMSLIT